MTASNRPENAAGFEPGSPAVRRIRAKPHVVDVEVTWRTLAALIALVTFIVSSGLVALLSGIRTGMHDELRETWDTYRADFITADGRVREPPPFDWGETTSEGQAYAMLRAAWLGDRPTFDRTWHWTQSHLQVRGDALFGWLWGRDQGGRWTLLNRSTAADADEDIALSLVFAAHRWPDGPYLADARAVISGVWAREVVVQRGRPYLVAGDWAADIQPQIVVNPSYLAPYAYRVFAAEDPAHPWAQLADSSYTVLDRCSWSRLNENGSVGLPPNWCVVSANSGTARAYWAQGGDLYGSDAFRVMWRVALDYEWNGAPQAISYLKRSQFLRREWSLHHRLLAQYEHNGSGDQNRGEESFAYAGDIGDFVAIDPAAARSILREKLLVTLHRDRNTAYWGDRANYYAQNWIWFGVALSEHRLVNLAEPWDVPCRRESAERWPCLVQVSLQPSGAVA